MAAPEQTICVTVTHADGLVLARSAFHHSVNYRSAVIFGVPRLVTDPDEKLHGLNRIVDHLVPGRSSAVREPEPQGAGQDLCPGARTDRGVGEDPGRRSER